MDINKTIKITQMHSTFVVKIRNILDVERIKSFIILRYWDPDLGKKEFKHIFGDDPLTWCDKDGNESTDYEKLVGTLTIYAEQTKLKDAIASLD